MLKTLIPILMLGYMGISQVPLTPLQPLEVKIAIPYLNTYEQIFIAVGYGQVHYIGAVGPFVPELPQTIPSYYSPKPTFDPIGRNTYVTYKVGDDFQIEALSWGQRQ